MDPVIEQYIRLAEIDGLIVAAQNQLAAYPRMIAGMDESEGAQRKTIAEARARAEAAILERRAAEKAVQDLREKIRKYTSQQNAVKTNKEYEVLTQQIERTRGEIDEQETIGLEKLEIEESCTARVTEAEGKLKRLTVDHAAERARIEQQTVEKRERLLRLQSERDRAAAGVEPDVLDDYETVNRAHPGSACAQVAGDHCSACGWQTVPHVQQAVLHGQLIRCEHCRRYLYRKP